MKSLQVLSMGAGVNTVAMLLRYRDDYDHVVFSDTGDEFPETYGYIERHIRPFCADAGIPFHTVRSDTAPSLLEYCMAHKMMPVRSVRWCTSQFKITPIRRFYRDVLGAGKDGITVTEDIGFALDESHRLKRRTDLPRYLHRRYPLMDDRITRAGCVRIIGEAGWPVPRKSGCDFCMYRRPKEMEAIRQSRPDRFMAIVRMEENAKNFPKYKLIGKKSLRSMMNGRFLDEWLPPAGCDSGMCEVAG